MAWPSRLLRHTGWGVSIITQILHEFPFTRPPSRSSVYFCPFRKLNLVSDYWVYHCQTIGLSNYWAVRLLGCQTIGLSHYWAVRLLGSFKHWKSNFFFSDYWAVGTIMGSRDYWTVGTIGLSGLLDCRYYNGLSGLLDSRDYWTVGTIGLSGLLGCRYHNGLSGLLDCRDYWAVGTIMGSRDYWTVGTIMGSRDYWTVGTIGLSGLLDCRDYWAVGTIMGCWDYWVAPISTGHMCPFITCSSIWRRYDTIMREHSMIIWGVFVRVSLEDRCYSTIM